MKTKIKSFANGHSVTMEKLFPSGMYCIEWRGPIDLCDRVRIDDYRIALAYYKAFNLNAKNA